MSARIRHNSSSSNGSGPRSNTGGAVGPSTTAPSRPVNAWSRPLQSQNSRPRIVNRQPVPKKPTQATSSIPNKPGPPPGLAAIITPTASGDPPNILRDRFLHLTQSLIGQRIVITQIDGTTLEGIHHTFAPFPNAATSIQNKFAIKTKDGISIIPTSDINHVTIKSIRLENNRHQEANATDGAPSAATFALDSDISKSSIRSKGDLIAAGSAWTSTPAPSANGSGGVAGLRGNIGEWDQFHANEQLFDIQASYDENMYTTVLDKSRVDTDIKKKAEKLAKEIQGSVSTNLHITEERGQKMNSDFDEEDLYSGVIVAKSGGVKKDYASVVSGSVKKKLQVVGRKIEEKKEENKEERVVAASGEKGADVTSSAAPVVTPVAIPSPPSSVPKSVSASEAANAPAPITLPVAEADSIPKETPAQSTLTAKTTTSTSLPKESKETDASSKASEPKKTSKLNPTAKAFSFNPKAASFTPSFAPAAPAAAAPNATHPKQQQQQQVPTDIVQQQQQYYAMSIPHPNPPGSYPATATANPRIPIQYHQPGPYHHSMPTAPPDASETHYNPASSAPPHHPGMPLPYPYLRNPPPGVSYPPNTTAAPQMIPHPHTHPYGPGIPPYRGYPPSFPPYGGHHPQPHPMYYEQEDFGRRGGNGGRGRGNKHKRNGGKGGRGGRGWKSEKEDSSRSVGVEQQQPQEQNIESKNDEVEGVAT